MVQRLNIKHKSACAPPRSHTLTHINTPKKKRYSRRSSSFFFLFSFFFWRSVSIWFSKRLFIHIFHCDLKPMFDMYTFQASNFSCSPTYNWQCMNGDSTQWQKKMCGFQFFFLDASKQLKINFWHFSFE